MKNRESLYSRTQDVKEAMDIIAQRMLELRPRGQVCLRPYRIDPASGQKWPLGELEVDLKKRYPKARCGDLAYVGTLLYSVSKADIALTVRGDAAVFFRGEKVEDFPQGDGDPVRILNLKVEQGESELLFLCRCGPGGFGVAFTPSVRHYPGMWAKDYLLHIRACSPLPAFHGEDGVGISPLYREEKEFDGEYQYPQIPEETGAIWFHEIFSGEKGQCAYALTYCLEDTVLRCQLHAPGRVLVNGQRRQPEVGIALKKGDVVLVKCIRSENWGFTYEENPKLGIPFLHSSRPGGDRWLTLGTFGEDGECLEVAMGPELGISFSRPYRDWSWREIYWKLSRSDDTIRPYLDTCFYGQWFYALMVGQLGLLRAGEALGRRDYQQYFLDSMQTMAEHFTYACYDAAQFGDPTFLARATQLKDLDSIGTMGMNLSELSRLTASPEALFCIEKLERAMYQNIPRFEDGAFYRDETMWADDVYMSCPFLLRLGKLTGKAFYYQECIRQIGGFYRRLYRKEKRLFSHIFFVKENRANEISWGRGNGWIFLSLAELLEQLPKETEGYGKLEALFLEFAQGILAQQDESGLWHQVLDLPRSYLETSCTGMFLLGICTGMRLGLLDPEVFEEPARRAVEGLLRHGADAQGNIYGVCRGSGCSMDPDYYCNLGTVENDDHGTGILLSSLAQFLRYEEKKRSR